MNYAIAPGLYAVGNADSSSPVMVTANYKLSFDLLRRELGGMNAWILVLDTKGINVWCAAGKGTFGTRELIERIIAVRLDKVVTHRRIIVPQLGAPGIHAHVVQKSTGFRLMFGPVHAKDIQRYIREGYNATSQMRTVRFTFMDRLVLTPMEMVPAFKQIWPWLLAILAVAGLNPDGVYFEPAISVGLPLALLTVAALLCGSFFTPILLPYIPFRSFAAKGWLFAAAVFAVMFPWIRGFCIDDVFLEAALYVSLPLLSSYVALNFTGATPYTGMSGVKKELRFAMPVYIIGIAALVVLVVISKLRQWGFA
jgi:hypothetical protein